MKEQRMQRKGNIDQYFQKFPYSCRKLRWTFLSLQGKQMVFTGSALRQCFSSGAVGGRGQGERACRLSRNEIPLSDQSSSLTGMSFPFREFS